jgi:hypothetical protein
MGLIKLLLTIIGSVALVLGLLWVGQGMGWIRWPESSFMIDDSSWSIRGAVLALGGALMIWYGRKR